MKVSALILTYNHERFIGEAIESFLRQETNFPCELVIADDCSTDGTREVIRRYWERYPDRIRVLLNRHNIKARRTIARAYQQCRGQYVATLEGDDYWTCPDKLQRQVDFLDDHPDCTICFHSVTMIWDDASQEPFLCRPSQVREFYTLDDLLEVNFVATCSSMYRRGVFTSYPAWHFIMPVGDWSQSVLHAQHGKIGYIDEPMGAYRQHTGGVYSGADRPRKLRIAIEMLRRFRYVVSGPHRRTVNRALCGYYCKLAHQYCDEGRHAEARRCLSECLREVRLCTQIPVGRLLNALGRAYTPGTQKYLKRAFKRPALSADVSRKEYAMKETE